MLEVREKLWNADKNIYRKETLHSLHKVHHDTREEILVME